MGIFLTPRDLALLIAGLVNFLMSVFIIMRGNKNGVSLFFSLLAFCNFIWTITILIARTNNNGMFWYYGGALLAYPIALLIGIFLYYFCLYFPIRIHHLVIWKHIILISPAILFSVLVYIKGIFILSYYKDIVNMEYTLYVNKPYYILYSVYFIILVFLALKELYDKIKISEYFFKKQIIVLLIAILVGLIFGIYFDLFLCYFANYHYAWLGPIFTLFMNMVVFYFITAPKEKING